MSISRTVGALTASAVVAGGLTMVAAQPAAAADSLDTLTPSSWAAVDSRSPHETLGGGDGDVRVGAWRDDDNKLHLSKGYFTFDLSELAGRKITRANIVATETEQLCGLPDGTELWTVDSVDNPTWANQPAEVAEVSGPSVSCRPPNSLWTVTDEVEEALESDADVLHVALRISDEYQGEQAYGREYYSDLELNVRTNSSPDVPSALGPCGTDADPHWTSSQQPRLSAVSDDRDGDWISGEFEVWPIDDSDQVTTGRTSSTPGPVRLGWQVPEGVVEHGRTYAWRVRITDENFTTAWSAECQFTVDLVKPEAPTVSSTDYPDDGQSHMGAAVPGEFTFDANGDEEVVGFYYGDGSGRTAYVEADAPGGTATIRYTPDRAGRYLLNVASEDRAGWRSERTRYEFRVAESAPEVDKPSVIYLGQEVEFTFSPRMNNVASYTYQLNGGEETTVAAGEDGAATVTVPVTRPDGYFATFRYWSTTDEGVESRALETDFFVVDAPQLSSEDFSESDPTPVGVEGTIRFQSWQQEGLAGFRYCVQGPVPEECGELTPDADGIATLPLTPTAPGTYSVRGYTINADGSQSRVWTTFRFAVTE